MLGPPPPTVGSVGTRVRGVGDVCSNMASPPAAQRCIPGGYNTDLHAAAFDNDDELMDTLLSSGSADIDRRGNPRGWTPLMVTAGEGHSQVVGILLNKGADLSVVNDLGSTALFISVSFGHVPVTRMLVNAGANLEAADLTAGWTPVMMAAYMGHSKILGILLNKGADLSVVDKWDATVLIISARLGHVAATRMLVTAGANLETAEPQGWTPLMVAAYNGHSQVVGILLNKGADLSVVDKRGATALTMSAGYGHVAVTRMLVNAGADLDAADSAGFTPLHMASVKDHSEVIKTLANKGANPDSRMPAGETPLFMAAKSGHVAAISELLRANANPLLGRMDTYLRGRIILPLDAAVISKHAAVVRKLIQQLGIQGCGGASAGADASRWAVQTQQYDIVVMLADTGEIDTGRVLIDAAKFGSEALVKILLQQQRGKHMDWDTYVNKKQPDGRTPVVCRIGRALRSGSPRVLRLFLDAGADTASTVRITNKEGVQLFRGTPLAYTTWLLRDQQARGIDSTKGEPCSLEAVRRMLLQLEAIRAVSWCWQSDALSSIERAVQDGRPRAKSRLTVDTPLGLTLPRRRKARARRVLVMAMSRYSRKPMSSREYKKQPRGVRSISSPVQEFPADKAPPANTSDRDESLWNMVLIVLVSMFQMSIWFNT
ncbi:unnamed protein product [Ectocarpus sp. CCAP 1310/34]|nr:unnamed protein product [Ectocarpus sp. CCAP 1310/34]